MNVTYRFTEGPERWKVDALKFDQLNRWQLYRAVDESWKGLRLFSTPEDAMIAVAKGHTGVHTWDTAARDPGAFTPDKWSREGW